MADMHVNMASIQLLCRLLLWLNDICNVVSFKWLKIKREVVGNDSLEIKHCTPLVLQFQDAHFHAHKRQSMKWTSWIGGFITWVAEIPGWTESPVTHCI